MKEHFRVGIPNTGGLAERVKNILIRMNYIDMQVVSSRRYHHVASNDTEIIFARSGDLPHLVAIHAVDVGITGRDYVAESGEPLREVFNLGLFPGNICLLAPHRAPLETAQDLEGHTIATQWPHIAEGWIYRNGLHDVTVYKTIGATEVYPYLQLAEATVDMVDSGNTARDNDLYVVEAIFPTSTCAVAAQEVRPSKQEQIDIFIRDLRAEVEKLII